MSQVDQANAVSFGITAQRVQLAILALTAYETLITFSDEINHIWPREKSRYLKISTFLLRYTWLFAQVAQVAYTQQSQQTARGCLNLTIMQSSLTFGLGMLASSILLLRTSALYRKRPRIFNSIWIMYGLTALVEIFLLGLRWGPAVHLAVLTPSMGPLHGCFIDPQSDEDPLLLSAVALLILWQFTVSGLALYKGFREHKSTNYPLYLVLYYDGFQYYVYILLIILADLIFVASMSAAYIPLAMNIFKSTQVICATRLIIHMRTVGDSKPDILRRYEEEEANDEDDQPVSFDYLDSSFNPCPGARTSTRPIHQPLAMHELGIPTPSGGSDELDDEG